MTTQQDIVDRLNQLTLRYNLTWYDIKYDADKAIAKINSFLGTKYPKMSTIMTHPEATYTLGRSYDDQFGSGTVYEIFPDEYIHSVVIPFIAMEVLARDEEFTTIYNKYHAELEEGLFTMFQNEFNRVPLVFRQNPDQGVFFPSDSIQGRIQRNKDADLPVFKFRVFYHINNPDIVLSTDTALNFVEDTTAYMYGDTAIVKGWGIDLLSQDGTKVYKFTGWSRDRAHVTYALLQQGDEITMNTNVHLYANWEVESTLKNVNGTVYILDKYKNSLTTLIIPEYVNGMLVTTIPSHFLFGESVPETSEPLDSTKYTRRLQSITLPKTVTVISNNAFTCFHGHTINIPEVPLTMTYDGITIENEAFNYTPNLKSIIIPANVTSMSGTPFPAVRGKFMNIFCRILERNVPDTWEEGWAAPSDPDENYTVKIWWGYNG